MPHGRRLAKTVHADGTIEQYDRAKTFDLIEMPLAGLDALDRLLRRLEHRPYCCVVRGAIADPTRTRGVRRLLYRDPDTGDEPALADVPRHWVALDFDSSPCPQWIDPADLLGCGCVAIRTLPNEFQQARFVVQATGSHGLKPGIRIRLWCWLDRPTSGSELKYWLRSAPVDRSVLGPAQVIYTAAPIFLPGAFDPLMLRLDMIPGEEVVVPAADRLQPSQRKFNSREFKGSNWGDVSGLVRAVETAAAGNRNALLYWAARRLAENPDVDHDRPAPFSKPQPCGPDFLETRQPQRSAAACAMAALMAELPPDDREEWLRKTRERLEREEVERNKANSSGGGANGHDRDHEACEEAPDQLRLDIGQLNDTSPPEVISTIIDRIAACAPDEISRDRLLATVKAQTGTGMGALRKQLGRVRAQKRARLQNASPSTPPEFSDDALALRFADQHEHKLRYVALWGKWMIWCGSYWKIEDTLKAFDLARAICRGASAKAPSEDQAVAIASAKTVNAVASLARSDRRFAETVDAWDCDQWALNTSTGTINTHK